MTEGVKVIGLEGSLAPHSNSLAAPKVALHAAAEEGVDTTLLMCARWTSRLFRRGMDVVPDAARELCDAAGEAPGMIWASPLNSFSHHHLRGQKRPFLSRVARRARVSAD
jgi:NAD(P)H-dependent FMN reductase